MPFELTPEAEQKLRSALTLLDDVATLQIVPAIVLEPATTRFRILGNSSGFVQLARRSIRVALGETISGGEPPDRSSWVIIDDHRWPSGDMLLSEMNRDPTGLTIRSSQQIRRKAWLFRSAPWFALGMCTQILLDVLLRLFAHTHALVY